MFEMEIDAIEVDWDGEWIWDIGMNHGDMISDCILIEEENPCEFDILVVYLILWKVEEYFGFDETICM